MEGAAEEFCTNLSNLVEESVLRATEEMKEGRQNPKTGEAVRSMETPPFLQLYRRCFQWILERHCGIPAGAARGPAPSAGPAKSDVGELRDLTADLKEACSALLRGGWEAGSGAGDALVRLVEERSLLKRLREEAPDLPKQLRGRLFSLANRDEAQVVSDPGQVSLVLRKLGRARAHSAARARRAARERCCVAQRTGEVTESLRGLPPRASPRAVPS